MPESIPSKETEISLREYLERAILDASRRSEDQVKAVEQHLSGQITGLRREVELIQSAAQVSIDKAEQAQQLRNEAMNEWRNTVTDILARYAEKSQVTAMREALEAKIDAAEKNFELRLNERSAAENRRMEADEKRVAELEAFKNNIQGRMWAMGAAVFFAATVLNLLLRFFFQAK